jgi:N-acetyl-gamma-glutamyl-phosphate reductase
MSLRRGRRRAAGDQARAGQQLFRVHVRWDERTGRVLVLGVLDNLVKGAAGQAVQAFNVVFGLPEQAGLEQLPLAP